MRRIWIVMMLVVTVGLTVVPLTSAVDVGGRAGWMWLSDDNSGAFLTGLYLRGQRSRVVHYDASLYYHTKEVQRGVDIEVVPLQLSGMLYLLGRDGVFCPFLLGGGGLYWTRTVGGRSSGSKLEAGVHLGAGFNYALSHRFYLEVEARYIWLRLKTRGQTVADALSDYNHLIGTVGLGFRL